MEPPVTQAHLERLVLLDIKVFQETRALKERQFMDNLASMVVMGSLESLEKTANAEILEILASRATQDKVVVSWDQLENQEEEDIQVLMEYLEWMVWTDQRGKLAPKEKHVDSVLMVALDSLAIPALMEEMGIQDYKATLAFLDQEVPKEMMGVLVLKASLGFLEERVPQVFKVVGASKDKMASFMD
ncbi:hypothetical protein TCAL_03089 [Tigriopus californicus]|uniref:Uncharacterized protein n=1 Tax=Tigriopus californicus TaxID=6832 RepID=A0A553NP25_TIGCA|nr:hypothetical protein TCAL_03089 [Tigriopus californicus]